MELNVESFEKIRYRYIDIARGICIISVVLGHLCNSTINRVVFTYHLPAFFLISGYFTRKEKIVDYIKKKLRTLIIPYNISVILMMLSCAVVSFFGKIEIVEIREKLVRILWAALYCAGDDWSDPFKIPSVGAIWFLWALFLGGLIFQILLRVSPRIRLVFVLLLPYLAKYSVDYLFFFPLSIQPACSAVFFIYCGYMWKKNENEIYGLSAEVKSFIIAVAAMLWLNFIISFQSFWLVHSDYGRGMCDIVASVGASAVLIFVSKYLLDKKNKLMDLLACVGEYSILFLMAHVIEITTFPWNIIISKILGDNITYMKCLCLVTMIELIWATAFTLIASRFDIVKVMVGIKKDL
ncbi:MAG: acyltransferase family protein [bacterium]|nr:acyltransferase family protein [bacterium]